MFKDNLRKLFAPVLKPFESGEGSYDYKPSHRKILLIVGGLFTSLALLVLILALGQDLAYLLPVLVFGGVGLLSLIIGLLGNDRAVAKIWNARR